MRQLQAERSGTEASLRMVAGGCGHTGNGGVGEEAGFDGPVSDVDGDGAEPDVDRAVLRVEETGGEISG